MSQDAIHQTATSESAGERAVAQPRLVLWRDIEIGETAEPGDRIITPDCVWTILNRKMVVGEHTFPVQRRVILPENDESIHP